MATTVIAAQIYRLIHLFFAQEDGVVRPYQFEPTMSVSSAVQGLGALEQNSENSDNKEWRLTDNSWYVLSQANLVII